MLSFACLCPGMGAAQHSSALLMPFRCSNRILRVNTNTGEVDLIGQCPRKNVQKVACPKKNSFGARIHCPNIYIRILYIYIYYWYYSQNTLSERIHERCSFWSYFSAAPGPDLGWGPDKYRAAIVATDGVPCHTFSALSLCFPSFV